MWDMKGHILQRQNFGNTKSSCVVPPLISHLFLAALRILTEPDDELDGK